ncbi:MAG: hypothetical protein IBX63_09470 [Coriobacteriia bacterium]|nr:hypothetical protein [Coriobacteriia bacterium]
MDWKVFRALETFALLYDIQVDEEDYQAAGGCGIGLVGVELEALDETLFVSYEPIILRSPNRRRVPRREWERTRLRLGSDAAAALPVALNLEPGAGSGVPGWTLPDGVRELLPELLEPDGRSDVSEAWRCLLIAKLARNRLMRAGGSMSEAALDELASLLVKSMPRVPLVLIGSGSGSRDVTTEDRQKFLLRVLYLCEVATCSAGLRSIAYSDEATQLVQTVVSSFYQRPNGDGKGETPYELLALYNKAQGRLHTRDHEEALALFGQVADYLSQKRRSDCPQPSYYFEPAGEPLSDLRWDATDWPLLRTYLGVPAALQAAETLINLQRAHDAGVQLPSVAEAGLTPYQRCRNDVIVKKSENDMGAHHVAP